MAKAPTPPKNPTSSSETGAKESNGSKPPAPVKLDLAEEAKGILLEFVERNQDFVRDLGQAQVENILIQQTIIEWPIEPLPAEAGLHQIVEREKFLAERDRIFALVAQEHLTDSKRARQLRESAKETAFRFIGLGINAFGSFASGLLGGS